MLDSPFSLFDLKPDSVFSPSSVSEVQDIVRDAQGQAICTWGGGTRQQLGFPPTHYNTALSLKKLSGVVDYQPNDLTITVEAGASISDVQMLLSKHNQRLPFEAALPDSATVGGAIATRADSLFRFSRPGARDSLLGVKVINHAGDLIQGGGRVVKNVSGYDLPKLYCGSLGTLGAIVEATLRVVAIPESSATTVLPLPAGRNNETALDTILGSDLAPSFLYLIGATAASAILPGELLSELNQYLIVGFDGSKESVSWQLSLLDAADGLLGDDAAINVRGALRDYPSTFGDISCSFHVLSSQVGAFLRMLEWTAARSNFGAKIIADAAVGTMWAHFSPETVSADYEKFAIELSDKAIRCGGSFIVERMPEIWRYAQMPVWSPILSDIELMKKLKKTLDPHAMWNPGRFIASI